MRLGKLIDGLVELARELPDGLDSEVVGGSCDGHGISLTGHLEVTTLSWTMQDGRPKAPIGLVRVHAHGDGVNYVPGVAERADNEMPDS